jgi:hypothetical protein
MKGNIMYYAYVFLFLASIFLSVGFGLIDFLIIKYLKKNGFFDSEGEFKC